MSGFCATIIIALVISLPVLLLVIAVRAMIKKPIKKVAIALAICASSIIPLTILGVVTDPATWCEHQYTVVKEIPANCATKGEVHKHCDLCDKKTIEYIECLPHTWKQSNIVDATCTIEGYTLEKCDVCGITQETEKTSALGHEMKETYRFEPTVSAEGKVVQTCDRCGYEEVTKLPSIESAGKNAPKKTDDGVFKYRLSEDKTYYIIYDVVDTSITTITIPESLHNVPVTCIGKEAFKYCNKLSSITIPNTITCIEEAAFDMCTGLTNVALPESITCISDSMFKFCSNLESVSIPENLTSIGEFAFSWCGKLESITIPKSVTSIGSSAFTECENLKCVYIEDITAWCGISFGGYHANPLNYAENFYIAGEYVKEIVIPEGITSIGDYTFSGYSTLAEITIPKSVKSIGKYAFEDCISLKNVYITDLAAWCNMSIEGYEASPLNYADHLYLNGELIKNLTIPSSVTSISQYTFYGYTTLESVTIHDKVTTIGMGAFAHCTGLTNLTLPDSVTSIGEYAFFNCKGIRNFTLGVNVTTIGNYAFDRCDSLANVTYKGTVEQWNLINKESSWDGDRNIRPGINCTDGHIAKNGEVTYN